MRKVVFACTVVLLACLVPLGKIAASGGHEPPPNLVQGVTGDPAVARILARSCQDCHSDRTRWPWYGHIPPASWMLNYDVAAARSRMDFSRWGQYSLDDKRQALTEIAAELRTNRMPPGRYLLMHPNARLSADKIALISAWTLSERHKLRMPASEGGNVTK